MASSPEPPPSPTATRRWRFLREFVESLRDMGSIGKACTCGNPRRIGPCPRHGKLN
jgi:hypothetical protein